MKKILLFAAALQLASTLHSQIDLTSNLVICMPIAGNANDFSGNSNNGLLVGSPALVPNRFGVANSAYKLNGISDYIRVPGSPSLDQIENTSELTISGYFFINNWYQGWNVFAIFDRYNSSDDLGWDYTVQAPVGCPEQFFNPNWPVFPSPCYYTGSGTTAFGTWIHYAITYSKANGVFVAYKNGLPVGTKPVSGLDLEKTNNGDAFIGYSPSGPDEYSDGIVDEIMVYNRALTSAEIYELFKNGAPCERDVKGDGDGGKGITGIKENKSNVNFAGIYPNPGNDLLNLSIDPTIGKSQDVTINMFAYDGKLVLTKTMPASSAGNYAIDINQLPQGVYQVNISSGDSRQNIKFVKQ